MSVFLDSLDNLDKLGQVVFDQQGFLGHLAYKKFINIKY